MNLFAVVFLAIQPTAQASASSLDRSLNLAPSAYANRVAFAQRLSRIFEGEDGGSVEQVLGSPDQIESLRVSSWSNGKAFYYKPKGCRYPSLGTVIFDDRDKVLRVYGSKAPNPALKDLNVDFDAFEDRIGAVTGLCQRSFGASSALKARDCLRSIPISQACLVLDEFVRVRPACWFEPGPTSDLITDSTLESNDGRLALLGLTLLGGRYPSRLGVQASDGVIGFKKPVEFVDGVPIVFAAGVIPTESDRLDARVLGYLHGLSRWPSIPNLPPTWKADATRFISRWSDQALREGAGGGGWSKRDVEANFLKQLDR